MSAAETGLTPGADLAESAGVDQQALTLRSQGKSFAAIAEALGLERGAEANRAFVRALRREPSDRRKTIRSEESRRLDRMAERVRANGSLSAEVTDKRLRAIERLRTSMMAD